MKELFKKIIEVLSTQDAKDKYEAASLPPVEYIDIYSGQYLNEEEYETFPHPAILFEWSVDYKANPNIASVNIHLCFEQLRDTSNISIVQELALKFFDFIEISNELLEDLETERTGKLERITEVPQQMGSIVNVQMLSYECSLADKVEDKYEYNDIENLTISKKLNIFNK